MPILWLRGLHRGYKFGILMIAAWAPAAFPRHPIVAAIILAVASAVFFLATLSERTSTSGNAHRESRSMWSLNRMTVFGRQHRRPGRLSVQQRVGSGSHE